jgi:hypothetical protein
MPSFLDSVPTFSCVTHVDGLLIFLCFYAVISENRLKMAPRFSGSASLLVAAVFATVLVSATGQWTNLAAVPAPSAFQAYWADYTNNLMWEYGGALRN